MKLRQVGALLLTYLTACAGVPRVAPSAGEMNPKEEQHAAARYELRVLTPDAGQPAPVMVSKQDFHRAMRMLAAESPLSAQPMETARWLMEGELHADLRAEVDRGRVVRLMPLENGSPLEAASIEDIARGYGRLCQEDFGGGDCLGLFNDGPVLTREDLRTLALALSLRHVLKETQVALMVWSLMDGWATLVHEVDRATSYEQIEQAAERFRKLMGENTAHVVVMLVTAAVAGGAAKFAAKLPKLPGFTQAAEWAEAQSLKLAQAGEVEAVAAAEEQTFTLMVRRPGSRAAAAAVKVPARALVIARTQLIDCTIEVKRELKNFRWGSAFLKGCKFKGRFIGNDFGEQPHSPGEGGLENCDFTEAHLSASRFLACDMRTVRLPSWPCFTIFDPVRRWRELRALKWPGDIGPAVVEGFSWSPPTSVAVTYCASILAKKSGTTPEAIRAVLEKLDGVYY